MSGRLHFHPKFGLEMGPRGPVHDARSVHLGHHWDMPLVRMDMFGMPWSICVGPLEMPRIQ
jgi:hypothetical protein